MVPRSTVGSTIGLALLLASLLATEPSALAQASIGAPAPLPYVPPPPVTYTVPAGTRIPLNLKDEVNTRTAAPGDPVYLVSDFPVVLDGQVLLPAGLYVRGVIDRVVRPGKVKGRAQIQLHFVSIILPNQVEVPLPGPLDELPGTADAKVKNPEGTVEEDASKGADAHRIGSTTVGGAGLGGLIGVDSGHAVMGSAVGAGAGAAVGILTTLFTRGKDIVLPQGTTMEMKLSRPLVLQQSQLANMPASTGINLQARPIN